MIVPVVNEADWLAALAPLPEWDAPGAPVVLIAPHPDDESLAAGGFIRAQRLRGLDVTVVAVTDGEHAYAGDDGLAELRCVEQTDALSHLGVRDDKIIRLGLTDGDVASREHEIVEQLLSVVSSGTHLIAPWTGDFHSDHEACGRAAAEAARQTGAELTFYFFWTWHFGTVPLVTGLPLRRFPLTPELLAAKSAAISCHRSQLIRDGGEPILPELLLAPARRPFEIFAVT